jgi:hypothetical protein
MTLMHTVHVTETPEDYNDQSAGHWFSGTGWYFVDECEQLQGPYDTNNVAEAELARYVAYLNSEQYSYAGE